MIFTYIFRSNDLFPMSSGYYAEYGIIINDYNITDLYVGF